MVVLRIFEVGTPKKKRSFLKLLDREGRISSESSRVALKRHPSCPSVTQLVSPSLSEAHQEVGCRSNPKNTAAGVTVCVFCHFLAYTADTEKNRCFFCVFPRRDAPGESRAPPAGESLTLGLIHLLPALGIRPLCAKRKWCSIVC